MAAARDISLGLDPQLVDLAVKGLEISDPSKATGWDRAVVLGGYGGDHGVARKRNEKGSSCQAMSLKPV